MQRAAFIVLALVASTAFSAPLDVPADRRVILASGKWTPSPAEADAAYRCVQRFVAHPTIKEKYDLRQIAMIQQHAREYRVQFVGQYRKGKKVVFCNFFPIRFPEEKQDGFDYWKRQLVKVSDGGFWFWQIEYDPQALSCNEFSSNGYG